MLIFCDFLKLKRRFISAFFSPLPPPFILPTDKDLVDSQEKIFVFCLKICMLIFLFTG